MSKLHFSWDPAKARVNLKKHGISFEEAQTVFYDENADLISDPEHSKDEDRFVILGMSMRTSAPTGKFFHMEINGGALVYLIYRASARCVLQPASEKTLRMKH